MPRMGVGSVKLGRGQLEFRGGTEKKLNLSSIKPHVIYVYFYSVSSDIFMA